MALPHTTSAGNFHFKRDSLLPDVHPIDAPGNRCCRGGRIKIYDVLIAPITFMRLFLDDDCPQLKSLFACAFYLIRNFAV